ncbi:hypothetical protein ALC57_03278 [Trachymyrmex cornetzi]|uniref:Uncharacterized protein n=1 Tax=Trachymyrmex cornetzi TaxID=471704 RepID=A0A195EGA7_9HYME|nr:hypothetical protein ALC57_03278 [Trachymyrmex cornetzi]
MHPSRFYDVTALRRIAMYLRRANRNRDRNRNRSLARSGIGVGRERWRIPVSRRRFFKIWRRSFAVRCDREGERKTDNRERFVGGCDESKSSSHWTELRKSVDREDLRETEEGGGGKGGGGDGGWW